jgi:ABC-type uncharacterized transport system permease subunit
MPSILLHLIPASLYAALGLHFWRTRWQLPDLAPKGGLTQIERATLLLALLVHGVALHSTLFPGGGMHFGFSVATSLMVWLAVLFYWIENFYARLDGLYAMAMPVATCAVLLPMIFPGQHLLENSASPVFRAHFIVAMLAYSLFTLAALHALLMSVAEKRLHRARLDKGLVSLPPLLTMESLLFRLITIAFVLLTLTLGSGILFSERLFGRAFSFEHKTIFAIASWVIFGSLLVGRSVRGWRGKTAVRWTLTGFVVLLLAYVGSHFVSEVILGRAY